MILYTDIGGITMGTFNPNAKRAQRKRAGLKTAAFFRGVRYAPDRQGYYRATSKMPRSSLHRDIYEAVYGPLPPGTHVHHKNGNKADNRLANLEALPGSIHTAMHANSSRPVQCVETGTRYPSAAEAARQLGLDRKMISQAIRLKHAHGGVHWKRAEVAP